MRSLWCVDSVPRFLLHNSGEYLEDPVNYLNFFPLEKFRDNSQDIGGVDKNLKERMILWLNDE